MTKIVQAVALLVTSCALVLLMLTAIQRPRGDPKVEAILARPSALDQWARTCRSEPNRPGPNEPLLAQARLLALYLAPPAPEPPPPESRFPVRPLAPVRSAAQHFQLCATSYYPARPDQSMALIGELQNERRIAHWVKAGSELGRLVVQEIRCGSVLCRDGDRVVELLVPRQSASMSLGHRHLATLAQAEPMHLFGGENGPVAE